MPVKPRSKRGLETQAIISDGPVAGSGLRYLPIIHAGNQNCSPEQAQAVADLVKGILQSGTQGMDGEGNVHRSKETEYRTSLQPRVTERVRQIAIGTEVDEQEGARR